MMGLNINSANQNSPLFVTRLRPIKIRHSSWCVNETDQKKIDPQKLCAEKNINHSSSLAEKYIRPIKIRHLSYRPIKIRHSLWCPKWEWPKYFRPKKIPHGKKIATVHHGRKINSANKNSPPFVTILRPIRIRHSLWCRKWEWPN